MMAPVRRMPGRTTHHGAAIKATSCPTAANRANRSRRHRKRRPRPARCRVHAAPSPPPPPHTHILPYTYSRHNTQRQRRHPFRRSPCHHHAWAMASGPDAHAAQYGHASTPCASAPREACRCRPSPACPASMTPVLSMAAWSHERQPPRTHVSMRLAECVCIRAGMQPLNPSPCNALR